MIEIKKSYQLGDMTVRYLYDSLTEQMGLSIIPTTQQEMHSISKKQAIDSLVQLKIIGDVYAGAYAIGNTLRQSDSVKRMKYKDQKVSETETATSILTYLHDERGYDAVHHLTFRKDSLVLEVYVELMNKSTSPIQLEMLSSFSLGDITPFEPDDAPGILQVHRLKSVWSMEGRLQTERMEDLQLEPSWAGHAVRSERFGQVGSMPVNQYFPYLAIEDTKNHVIWGAELAHNASWQMEIYRKDDQVAISGGLADREFGQWVKGLQVGETVTTPTAWLTVCHYNKEDHPVDKVSNRLVSGFNQTLKTVPASEESLPIIFNEYCTTWGNPSHDNIMGILDRIQGRGFDYFVIDCGWYKEPDVPWDISMGDYDISKELFPEGLDKTVRAIRETGLKPGIWFEIENVGSASRAYRQTEHLLQKDGYPLTTSMRRFWNMSDPWVREYLEVKVTGLLESYGFEYIKIDYNETIGTGCDHKDSLGEGLRQNMASSVKFIERMKEKLPELVIENCASGGHRLEPLMVGLTSMSSFSDAHECEEIPIIAANLHRVMPPRQSQIWAVIQKEDTLKRIAYSLTATMLGRMCLSGHVTELDEGQWAMIQAGMDFYKKVSPVIKAGESQRYGTEIVSYRHPKGWQALLREGEDGKALLIIHTFTLENPTDIYIPLNKNYAIVDIYSDTDIEVNISRGSFMYKGTENMKGMAIYMQSK